MERPLNPATESFRRLKTEAIVLGFQVRRHPEHPRLWYWICGDENCLPLSYATEDGAWMAAIQVIDALTRKFRAERRVRETVPPDVWEDRE